MKKKVLSEKEMRLIHELVHSLIDCLSVFFKLNHHDLSIEEIDEINIVSSCYFTGRILGGAMAMTVKESRKEFLKASLKLMEENIIRSSKEIEDKLTRDGNLVS